MQQGGEGYLQSQIENEVYGNVMSDEQMEELRKQIVAYTVICEQLAQLHKAMSAHHDFTGIRLGNLNYEPIAASGSVGLKFTSRQRWTPTSMQLQILESIYNEQGNGTPSKQKIKDITAELAHHGQISESNVYNWFQNRRARSKRKQQEQEAFGSTHARPESDSQGLEPGTLEFIDNPTSTTQGMECFYFQNSDIGIEQLIGKVEPYGTLVEQFGLLG